MRPATAPLRVLLVLLASATALAACTSSGGGNSSPAPALTRTTTVSATHTVAAPARPTAPASTGPTTAARAAACPLLPKQRAADRVGMRLARIMVLHSAGRVVGCRFYALQDSTLSQSEHLPGPNQPVIEIDTAKYGSALAAHNAFVLAARAGTNPQQFQASMDNTGVCFQIAFYAPDKGRDWACAFSIATTVVVVRTVVVSPALNVVEVSRVVAGRL